MDNGLGLTKDFQNVNISCPWHPVLYIPDIFAIPIVLLGIGKLFKYFGKVTLNRV